MLRTALYHRVSTRDQNPALAHEELTSHLTRLAGPGGFKVILDIQETGSGVNNDRRGLQDVLEASKLGRVDVVVVWKLDRFGRSVIDVLHNVRVLREHGVRFCVVTQGIDIKPAGEGDPVSNLMLTMLAAVAEFERDLIVERTLLGVKRARERGIKLGPPQRVIDVVRIEDLRKRGVSWPKIAKELGCGISTAKRRFNEMP